MDTRGTVLSILYSKTASVISYVILCNYFVVHCVALHIYMILHTYTLFSLIKPFLLLHNCSYSTAVLD